MKPLAGVRVIELTSAVAGPFAGRLLADLGADVIKVEPPEGDFIRGINLVGGHGFSAMFQHSNAGKRAVTLDLKSEDGRVAALALVRASHVVLENFAPGVMARLGLDYDSLTAVNPSVIMCSVSSYGQTGSHASFVGADPVGLAMSGMTYMTGEPDGPPYMANNGIADTSTGSHAVLAILAALYARTRTGEGTHLDIGMCDVMLTMDCCNVPISAAANGTVDMHRYGNHNRAVTPCGVFAAQDGHVLIEAWGEGPRSLWGRLCSVMERPELIEDPRYRTNAARVEGRDEVTRILEDWLASQTRDEAMSRLNQGRVVAAPVLSPAEVINHAVTRDRRMIQPLDHAGTGTVGVVAAPYKASSWSLSTSLAPERGADTDAVLRHHDLGLPDDVRERIIAAGGTANPEQ